MTYSSANLRLIRDRNTSQQCQQDRPFEPERISTDTRSATCSSSRAGSYAISSSGPSARHSPLIWRSMHKLETGLVALLDIGGQGHVTSAYAANINAFLIIASFIPQTQSIVGMCFVEAQRQVRVLQDLKPARSLPKLCERVTAEMVDD